jgi:aryl-alcohol dehydrogenase-like predicted oxidoreductase
MKKRKLGKQGLEVSQIGLGCMGMSYAYQPADEVESLKVLDRAVELGITFFDTAEAYGPFKNEELLAKALKSRRDKLVLATKVAWKNGVSSPDTLDGSPASIQKAVEGCLLRLQTSVIDLLYLHRADPKVSIEESVGGMAQLVKQGKVRYIGLSEVGPNSIRKAHAVHPLTCLQSEYSLWETNLEEKILPVLRELGIGLVPFSPVGRGFLSGAIKSYEDLGPNDMRRNLPRFQGENFKENIKLVEEVTKLAKTKGATASQAALAWLIDQGEDIVPIPGTTKVKHLEENVAACDIPFTPEDFKAIDDILEKFRVFGNRYNPSMEKMVNRD